MKEGINYDQYFPHIIDLQSSFRHFLILVFNYSFYFIVIIAKDFFLIFSILFYSNFNF